MDHKEFDSLPSEAAWYLEGAYQGFEFARFTQSTDGIIIEGSSLGVEDGTAWNINYQIRLSPEWYVYYTKITSYDGLHLTLETDTHQNWKVNNKLIPQLHGCKDIDLEVSTVTNTIPIHRLSLLTNMQGESRAVYVKANGLKIETLDQSYKRLPDRDNLLLYEYRAPQFDYHGVLKFNRDGLVMKYPGIGERVL